MNASTAYELCLSSLKESYYQKHQISEVIKESIDKKYRQIKQLSELIKIFYSGEKVMIDRLPNGIKLVAEIRNKAIHEGRQVEFESAKNALDYVKDFIYTFRPIK